jgi:hypothetical protein
MGDIPLLWQHDPTKFVGRCDLDTNEITFHEPFVMGGPDMELTPLLKILESEEVDGVTFIKKAKLLALSVGPRSVERKE